MADDGECRRFVKGWGTESHMRTGMFKQYLVQVEVVFQLRELAARASAVGLRIVVR